MKSKIVSINPLENVQNLFKTANNLLLESNKAYKEALEATLNILNDNFKGTSINNLTNNTDFYTLPEVCNLMNVPKTTVYSWIKNKKIPFSKPTGRLIFNKMEITNFLLNK